MRAAFPFILAGLTSLAACGDDGAPPEQAAPPDAAAARSGYGAIDRDRLLNADAEPGQWMTTGRDMGKSHFSPLDTIDRGNVNRLGLAWDYDTFTNRGLEATPIVVDGVMYTSGTTGRVYALDAATGQEIWYFDPAVDRQINRYGCCDEVNRGVAVWEGLIYVAALDGRLFALNAETGAVEWEVDTITDRTRGYTSTGAPAVAGDVVVIGNAGAELDARGYITAYDLKTGDMAWRFFTVPRDPALGQEHPELDMALETWDPDSRWEVGLGGTVWDAMVYDPELNLLYVGTGNAALYNRAERSPSGGDNLFLTSILAIDPKSGRLVWHYQEVPGDRWDYTATQPIVLADLDIGGEVRKVLMQAPKNGFFYVIDRRTGDLISAENYVPQNWAKTIDPDTGKAVVDADAVDYADGPKYIYPSNMGGHVWNPMSYSPQTGLVYIPVIEAGMYMFDLTDGHEYRPGRPNGGVTTLIGGGLTFGGRDFPPEIVEVLESGALLEGAPDPAMRAYLRAWDPIRGETAWERETSGWYDRSGVLSTGGGLVFQGSVDGHFRVFDAQTGGLLKDIDTGSSIMAAPMTYMVGDTQYVSVMAAWGGGGWALPMPGAAFARHMNEGRILTFRLDGGPVPKPAVRPDPGPIPEPPAQRASAETIARGGALFARNCTWCHANAPRALTPDLRRMSPQTHDNFNAIVLDGTRRALGMPQWDDVLEEDDADAIHAYLIDLSRRAHEAQEKTAVD